MEVVRRLEPIGHEGAECRWHFGAAHQRQREWLVPLLRNSDPASCVAALKIAHTSGVPAMCRPIEYRENSGRFKDWYLHSAGPLKAHDGQIRSCQLRS